MQGTFRALAQTWYCPKYKISACYAQKVRIQSPEIEFFVFKTDAKHCQIFCIEAADLSVL
jgi:hypothetical protein